MKLDDLITSDQLRSFLSGTEVVPLSIISGKDANYRCIQGELVWFNYMLCSRQDKGVVIRYLMKVSGYSRQQITRLLSQYRTAGRLQRHHRTASGFSRRYLILTLQQMFEAFPFTLHGFHSDNSSEYINARVAGLLDRALRTNQVGKLRKYTANPTT